MKQFFTLFVLSFLSLGLFANTGDVNNWTQVLATDPEAPTLTSEMTEMGLEQFLALTPKKYKEITGKKLGIKKAIQLKVAQKIVKKKLRKNAADIDKGVYILLAILGLGWLAIGLITDWDGSDWLVALLLGLLCWLPGVIYSLIRMKNYY